MGDVFCASFWRASTSHFSVGNEVCEAPKLISRRHFSRVYEKWNAACKLELFCHIGISDTRIRRESWRSIHHGNSWRNVQPLRFVDDDSSKEYSASVWICVPDRISCWVTWQTFEKRSETLRVPPEPGALLGIRRESDMLRNKTKVDRLAVAVCDLQIFPSMVLLVTSSEVSKKVPEITYVVCEDVSEEETENASNDFLTIADSSLSSSGVSAEHFSCDISGSKNRLSHRTRILFCICYV